MTHEIPQEVGDYTVLLNSGMSRGHALLLNLATSLTSMIGGVIAYFALGSAMDLLPVRHRRGRCVLPLRRGGRPDSRAAPPGEPRESVAQVVLITLGIVVIALAEAHVHAH